MGRATLRDAHCDMAAGGADQALQVAHAGLTRVVADDRADRVLGDFALVGREAGLLELTPEQIALGDFELFVLGVTGKLDDLHAVAHRARDRIQHVGGGDEHHLGEVEGHAEVIVAERRVLLGVEHFEQRR